MISRSLLFLALLLTTFIFVRGRKHKCYECNPCPEPFSTSGVSVATDCDQCGTVTTYSGGKVMTSVRQCMPVCIASDKDVFGNRIKTDCCSTDLCNGASSIQYKFIALFAACLLSLTPVLLH
ncbi:unnamed protein product [Calicophoron daubneyi]|uniref:UPAR/Ly6 domain-containing protein n=1 Tax=Calicophoron daubneyi TaxID=300641 RepID=A0AAV2TXF5_CALDB